MGFLFFPMMPMGLRLAALRAAGAPLLDRNTLLLMINAFVFSKLFYCSTVWGNTSKSNIKKLQLVQNFAGKIVLGLKNFDHISQGLKSLEWLSIEDKLRLNTAVMVHKCLHHQVPIYLKDKFVYRSQVHNRQLRSLITMISTCHTVSFLLAIGHLPFEEQKFGTRSPWI